VTSRASSRGIVGRLREILRRRAVRLIDNHLAGRFAGLDSRVQALTDAIERLNEDAGRLSAGTDEFRQRLRSIDAELSHLAMLADNAQRRLPALEYDVAIASAKLEVSDDDARSLDAYRASDAYARLYTKPTPRVSVCIATFNRSDLLVRRALASVLAQDYGALEVIVVGDGCTDDTEDAVRRLADSRVTFVNLPERERYPNDPDARWMVGGTKAANRAMALATGDLITHIDDDDECSPDRLRRLVGHLQETGAEFVWHPFWFQDAQDQWSLNETQHLQLGQVTTGSVLYLSWLKRIPWDPFAYRYREPGDWNRFRKLKYLGLKTARFPEPLLRHYRERAQTS
jgi:Glycosyl transferase family 2